ncbi:hypothetical protein DL237_16700 [Pseudooceanicola sediminis]|uniref:Peptidase inhibitor I78 n=1 Tax=Pseudooceanicola sediminis TaxID=2211117 RepID=A0A399IX35_9RHOB|nr:I78 family peptidase inhibitor [Pseudooceanicola sediminis]KAA2312515.1 hypothetical protein E0K93_16945 [Puniceibacterium sp. HSS470]RII37524.1 hypothetical protein DL237_16700 [Pseudooceanicola sediminis]|tara:strand:+ start:70187 stop:70507 length:321 start_codon:yes stop_codon:yes gene_type:complete
MPRRHSHFALMICLAMLGSGCSAIAGGAPDPAPGKTVPVPPASETTCGAEDFNDLIGKIWSPELLGDYDGKLRVLEKGSMATMDYVIGRLNVRLDEDGRVESLSCG